MTGLTDLLQTMGNLQVDAQANVPVTPNNGNPAGANNMPHTQQQVQPAAAYPWLQASPHMASVRQRLASMQSGLAQTQQPPAAPQPAIQAPSVQTMETVPQLPVLPQRLY